MKETNTYQTKNEKKKNTIPRSKQPMPDKKTETVSENYSANQYFAQSLPRISEKTDSLRQLLKQRT